MIHERVHKTLVVVCCCITCLDTVPHRFGTVARSPQLCPSVIEIKDPSQLGQIGDDLGGFSPEVAATPRPPRGPLVEHLLEPAWKVLQVTVTSAIPCLEGCF